MKTNPRCDHVDGDRRCPDSAGWRIRYPSSFLSPPSVMRRSGARLKPGRFCGRHAQPAADRVPLARLPPEDR
jgi:hypothetical protein